MPLEDAMLIGAEVSVDTGTEVIKGVAQKIDDNGYLWLKTSSDKIVKIIAGDVVKVKSQK